MNCNVIQDLMILYTDKCCCDESREIIEEHIKTCSACKMAFDEMTDIISETEKQTHIKKVKFTRIDSWKASIMQSILLYISFALLTFGVANEAATPSDSTNGLWAISVIVPVTGFLLSLANWYFVRFYPSRKIFSVCSLISTVVFTSGGIIWSIFHYKNLFDNLFNGSFISVTLLCTGIVMYIVFLIISGLLSDKYAKMLGKE